MSVQCSNRCFGRARESARELVSASRARAQGEICAAMRPGGLAVLTGEAGSGKTWLTRRMIATDVERREWLWVDAHPSLEPVGLRSLLLASLGFATRGPSSPATADLAIADALEDASADGRRYGLVVDEAQLASAELFETLRVLSNGLGSERGFDAMLVLGQTALRRRMRTRRLAAFWSRVAVASHLGPIDADEAGVLLQAYWPDHAWSDERVEELHRDSRGNPRMLLRLGEVASNSAGGASEPAGELRVNEDSEADWGLLSSRYGGLRGGSAAEESELSEFGARLEMPIVPSRPVESPEENVVEVGWDAADDANETGVADSAPGGRGVPWEHEVAGLVQRRIDDPYAQLQAAIEEEAAGIELREGLAEFEPRVRDFGGDSAAEGEATPDSAVRGAVWPDAPHPFEPYGDLFTPRAPAAKSRD